MSVLNILRRAESLGVRVALNGDAVRLLGRADAVAAIKPEIAAHKPEILGYLRSAANDVEDLSCYPWADGPYMPYVVPMSSSRVAVLLDERRSTINKLADLEGWADDRRAHLLDLVARQPLSTLADDLTYFRCLLDMAQSVERAAQAVSRACCILK